MEEKIKEIFTDLGADLFGIAAIERFTDAPAGFHPTDIYKDCRSVLVFALSLPKGLAAVSPRIVYNNANNICLDMVDRISLLASREIEKLGGIAVPVPCDSPYEYWDSETTTGKGILSMRHAAALAGLGSLGKSTLLINREYGNMITIGAVLTNLDLQSSPLSEKVCLDNCRLCLDHCPQKAIEGKSVNQKLCRAHTYTTNGRGFGVCNCNTCRVICPKALGKR